MCSNVATRVGEDEFGKEELDASCVRAGNKHLPAATLCVRLIGNGVCAHLPHFYYIIFLSRRAPGALSHYCVFLETVNVVWSGKTHSVSRVLPNYMCSSLANNERHRQREQENHTYGFYTVPYRTVLQLSHHPHIVLGVDEVDHLTYTISKVPGTRFLSSFLLVPSTSTLPAPVFLRPKAFLRSCVSSPTPDTQHTWHEVARFSSPQNLSCVFSWVFAPILHVSLCSSCPYSNLSGRLLSMSLLSSHAS